jgi:2-polyprenyl-3-methyl-5-hydroxy-6-metoxy-1,4-benzoquinol methylase
MGGRIAQCGTCGLIQSVIDANWQRDWARIVSTYDLYHQGGGLENTAIAPSAGLGRPRSRQLIERLLRETVLNAHGKLLDIGCANGNLLREFQTQRPSWQLAGFDVSPARASDIAAISPGTRFFTENLNHIDDRFDLVVLLHVFEHIVAPRDFLRDVKRLMKPDGLLLIQVPDTQANPIDLVITDHCSHFALPELDRTLSAGGFIRTNDNAHWLGKELTAVARVDDTPSIRPSEVVSDNLDEMLQWLDATIATAAALAATPGFGIFGSSIGALWLDAELDRRAYFFVDEDPSRIGQSLDGRPIVSPSDVPANSNIFIPIAPPAAAQIASRLGQGTTQYHAPPPWPPHPY